MHITILTYGTRGDIQPFLALAVALQNAGHTTRLAAPERFSELAARHKVPFFALAGDPADISLSMSNAGTNIFRMVKSMKDHVKLIASRVVKQARVAAEGTDLLVHSFLFTTGAHSFAREMGIPDFSIQMFPMFAPTRAFPHPAFGNLPPGVLSALSHRLADAIFWYGGNLGYNSLRKDSPGDFPRILYWPFQVKGSRPPTPLIFAYSPTVLPKPADWDAPHIHVPGYFFLNEPDYQPPPFLTKFLADGASPICFSFGSTLHRESERIGRIVLAAISEIGCRGVFLTGWGGWKPATIPENACFLEEVPHEWLFPRCVAVVHHGGAGTTGAGLRAGVPNLIIPHGADQPFWGRRVADLGVGPAPIPVNKLSKDSLSKAINQALYDPIMRQSAVNIGNLIQKEVGCHAAVRIIETWAADFRS